jgi:hypothetical protein
MQTSIDDPDALSRWRGPHVIRLVRHDRRIRAHACVLGEHASPDQVAFVSTTARGRHVPHRVLDPKMPVVPAFDSKMPLWQGVGCSADLPEFHQDLHRTEAPAGAMTDEAGVPRIVIHARIEGAEPPRTDIRALGPFRDGKIRSPPQDNNPRIRPRGERDQQFTTPAYRAHRTFAAVVEACSGHHLAPSGRCWTGAVLDRCCGCGCGRMRRQLIRALGGESFFGANIDRGKPACCIENPGGGMLGLCRTERPLPRPQLRFHHRLFGADPYPRDVDRPLAQGIEPRPEVRWPRGPDGGDRPAGRLRGLSARTAGSPARPPDRGPHAERPVRQSDRRQGASSGMCA